MTRRVAKPTTTRKPRQNADATERPRSLGRDEQAEGLSAAQVGERVRRIALGLTAALVTARAYWPSEPDVRIGAGGGLFWVLGVLVAAGIAVTASFIGGWFRWRWSWTDAAFALLVVLVAISANHAVDRRPAINLAWEWVALGVIYVLVRNLPRTPQESSVLAGALVATAVAVSVYGLYQGKVELPLLQEHFKRNPQQVLQELGIQARTAEELQLRDRLLNSKEVFSTFALSNSLAGFIVGPLVLALSAAIQNLVRRDAPGSRWAVLGLAAPLVLAMLVCLILTRSRSSWIGLLVGMGLVGWEMRKRAPARVLWGAVLAGVVVVIAVVVGAWAAGRLDRGDLTQAQKSLRYRWEYWQGTWGVLTDGASDLRGIWSAATSWWGVGPGNFAGPYLRHKLPQASEAIQDPHNLFLEVWATAGLWALVALLAALGCGLWNLFGPSTAASGESSGERDRAIRNPRKARRMQSRHAERVAGQNDEGAQDEPPPSSVRWLIVSAGAGWILVLFVGDFNLFKADLFPRWLILGGAWMATIFLGRPLWARLPIWVTGVGAAVVALVISLLAAGGIGIPTVALGLWTMLALGLNLREDRGCGRLRVFQSRMPALGLAVACAAMAGTFFGLVLPFWRAEAAMARAEEARGRIPPDFERADWAYKLACTSDRYYSRPWLHYASLYENDWVAHGAKPRDDRLKQVTFLLDMAVNPPRNPYAWAAHREYAAVIARVLSRISRQLDPREIIRYQGKIVEECRKASRLNPTNAGLHADLAEASASISMFRDAALEAEEALQLDRITPHLDKKLPDQVRSRLMARLPEWKDRSAQNANLEFRP